MSNFDGDQSLIEIAAAIAAPKEVVSAIAGLTTSIPAKNVQKKITFRLSTLSQNGKLQVLNVTVEVRLYLH